MCGSKVEKTFDSIYTSYSFSVMCSKLQCKTHYDEYCKWQSMLVASRHENGAPFCYGWGFKLYQIWPFTTLDEYWENARLVWTKTPRLPNVGSKWGRTCFWLLVLPLGYGPGTCFLVQSSRFDKKLRICDSVIH